MITLDSKYVRNSMTKQALALKMWNRFMHDGWVDEGILPESIVSSWRRCREYRVDPYMPKILGSVEPDFEERYAAKKNFLEIAMPYLEEFCKLAEYSGFVITVTDEKGMILERIGNKELIKQQEKHNIVPGVSFDEKTSGTTATALTLLYNRPIQIFGAEHYCKLFHTLSCSAAPVRNPKGKTEGVILMSAYWEKAHPHTLGMVTSVADSITNLFALYQEKHNLQILYEFQNAIIESFGSGLLAVDNEGRIVHVNTHVDKLLNTKSDTIKGVKIETIFPELSVVYQVLNGRRQKIAERGITLSTADRITDFSLSCYPVNQHGETVGAIIILREPELIKKIVNRTAHGNAKFTFNNIIGKNKK